MARRRYTDQDRAATLAALQANAGNVTATAKATGVPPATISRWRDEPPPGIAELGDEKKRDLAAELERIAYALAEAIPGKIHDASLQHVSVSLGIAIDKLRLLKGEATEVTEVRGSDARRELAERIARLTTPRPSETTGAPN